MVDQNHDGQRSVHNIENELSKYSLDDTEISQLLDNNQVENIERKLSSTSSLSVSSSDSLPSTNTTQSQKDPNSNNTLIKELNNGLIHGHIHNFENFTYIHGHIHTNEQTSSSSPPPPQISELKNFHPQQQSSLSLPTVENDDQSQRRRRRSSHRHFNEPESSQFSDCQHFEFLNCHDKNSILNSEIQCNEDHENCVPKIVEICCDNKHDSQNDLIPIFPSCTDHEQTEHVEKPLKEIQDEPKLDLNCAGSLDDCIDIKCDLDTCNIDELYCRYCEDIDQITNESTSTPIAESQPVKLENKDSTESNNNNNYMDILNDLQRDLNQQQQQQQQQQTTLSKNNDTPLGFTNPMDCINPNCNAFKRHREDDDQQHQHTLHHHLHHHSFQHSDNHHHHHIQIHDHQPKKIKKNIKTNDHDFINFEWNFKNQTGAKCEWENCSTTLDNSFQLQNHIMEDHLLSEYNVPLQSTSNPTGSFECEWKNCDYSGYDLFSLVNHINGSHGFQYDFDINNIFKKNEQLPQPQSLDFPTPCSDSSEIKPTITTQVVRKSKRAQCEEECEETTCKWVETSSQGEIIKQCNEKFSNAQELTDHLIHHHVGSGKSEYTCLWENCSRNHRIFNQRQKIIRHLHVHTRYKPFICKVCNHSFAVESMLEQHMRTHSGEKPYKCKVCDKHFATSSSLSIHVRTHTGEKPLVCKYPGCGKRFSESSNLTKHIKTHEKFFKCDYCAKSFSKDKQLQSHMAKYHAQV
ncbi:hypothetical protein WICANDRAFT_76792 [Wickerhamomyces anomalus NRRL Y-366-8]|uniref:C2H2-type domain-containing protein n=1 Tax=Wickerhamomyces anomalus (strain ATCC 58044 / CBS 1984 / NCYC 433 / NRRL Y-366-8) TaxID=683960 RepID=A0A1E3PBE7_WICAA|nr:uncharacterized protein WICANDRAFT_76792 [Wickerhamomyces anomalus NRRL Y-366-8]ODQ62620.1 hypothetical protein WICANDRAFT_76792 [Wickerhamomyces anomalus NRRL Y-366-8]